MYINWRASSNSNATLDSTQHHLKPNLYSRNLHYSESLLYQPRTANMKATIATSSLLAMQAASVLAAPVIEGKSVLSARATTLYEGEGGYATVEYGDGLLNYGARDPATILDIIRDECLETACDPSGGLGFTSLVINADTPNDVSYTVSVQGSFNPDGERGSKAQLLDLAR
jgi:hypothetical protein